MADLDVMRDYYERGAEQARLSTGPVGRLEFERTKEISLRHLPPLTPADFSAYLHRPAELRDEVATGGFEVIDLVSVEGPVFLLDDLDARLADDDGRRFVMETARALERVPELLGIGPHLLVTGRK